jgi:uncharacterized protein YrrD
MIRFAESRGRPVVTRKEGAIIGKLDDFQFDLKSWQIYGYLLRSQSLFRKAGGVRSEDLDQVGRDVAFIRSESQVEWIGGTRNSEDGGGWGSRYLQTKAISRDGAAIGAVEDLVYQPADRRVLAVILTGNRIALLDERVSTGAAAVVLASESVAVAMPEVIEGETPEDWWRHVLDATTSNSASGLADRL